MEREREKKEKTKKRGKEEGRRTHTWHNFLHPKNNSRLSVKVKKYRYIDIFHIKEYLRWISLLLSLIILPIY